MLLYLHQSFKMDCCLTNSDAHVAGGSEDGKIYFWDLVDAQVVTSFQAHSSVVTTLFFSLYFFCSTDISSSCGAYIHVPNQVV